MTRARALFAVAALYGLPACAAARPKFPGTKGGSTIEHFPFCWKTLVGGDETDVCPPQTGCYPWDELVEEVNPTGKGKWDAEVPWFNVGGIKGTNYTADKAEMKDGVAMRCQCYSFYGMEPSDDGTECVPGPNSSTLTMVFYLIMVADFLFAFSYGLTTLVQMIMAGAFQFNPATITLVLSIMSAVFTFALMAVYLGAVGGSDADYSMNDMLRGPFLGLFLVGAVAASLEVLVMWIDVLGKSKRMTAKSTGMKKLKTGLHAFSVFLLFFAIVSLAFGLATVLAVFAGLLLIGIVIAFICGGKRLAKLMQGTSGTKSAAVGAIECVAFRYPVIFVPAFLGLGGYGALASKFKGGHVGFLGICLTFFCAQFLLNVLVSYVRFGARKKLAKCKFMQENLDLGPGTGGTTMAGTKVAPQMSGTVSTADLETPRTTGGANMSKINPVLHFLNRFWAMGFPL